MLSPDESRLAAAEGWQLASVWCSRLRKVQLQLLPTDMGKPFRTKDVEHEVFRRAKAGNKVALRAIALVFRDRQS